MPINPAIALQFQPLQAPDMLGMTERAMRLSDFVRAQQADEAERGAYAFQPSGNIDRNATLRNLAQIDPRLAMKQSYHWKLGDLGEMKATRENERIQGVLRQQEETRKRQALAGAAQEYFRTLQSGADENSARQAGANALMLAGYRDEPFSLQFLAGGGAMDAGGDEDFSSLGDVSLPDDGGFMPVGNTPPRPAAKPAPAPAPRPAPLRTPIEAPDPSSMPDTVQRPGRAGPDYNWQKAYEYTRLQFPKWNPLTTTTVLDWQTGQPIVNEPLVGARERIAAAGRSVINAAGGNIDLGKPAQNKVDEVLLNSGARLQRLKEIESVMKPEYLQFGTMAKGGWANLKDKLGLASQQEKALVADMARAYSTGFEDLNATIKEASGATVTPAEAGRLYKQMPKPPTGPLDWGADGPSEYFAKLQQNVKMLKLAEARAVYIKKNGLTLDDGAKRMPLEAFPRFMNERGAQIAAELKRKLPNMNDAERDKAVLRGLASEFGLVQ